MGHVSATDYLRNCQKRSEEWHIIVELAFIERAHLGRTFRASFVHNSGDVSHIIKVIRPYYRICLCCNDYLSVNMRVALNSLPRKSKRGYVFVYGIILIQFACSSFRCTLSVY